MGLVGLCPPGPTCARARSTLVADTSSGMHARIPRWDPGMRIPVQVCAYLSIPGLGSPDWVTLDSVTSNTLIFQIMVCRTRNEFGTLSSRFRECVSEFQIMSYNPSNGPFFSYNLDIWPRFSLSPSTACQTREAPKSTRLFVANHPGPDNPSCG